SELSRSLFEDPPLVAGEAVDPELRNLVEDAIEISQSVAVGMRARWRRWNGGNDSLRNRLLALRDDVVDVARAFASPRHRARHGSWSLVRQVGNRIHALAESIKTRPRRRRAPEQPRRPTSTGMREVSDPVPIAGLNCSNRDRDGQERGDQPLHFHREREEEVYLLIRPSQRIRHGH